MIKSDTSIFDERMHIFESRVNQTNHFFVPTIYKQYGCVTNANAYAFAIVNRNRIPVLILLLGNYSTGSSLELVLIE